MDKVTIKIPRPLYERIQAAVAGSGFSSPTDFVVYVMRDVLGEMHVKRTGEDRPNRAEMEAIRDRLRDLGYL
jgi:Arc/MetJ-type ribon-helix-helix transcriptional regulator